MRNKTLPRPLVFNVNLKRIAADKAGIRPIGAKSLIRGTVNSTVRTDHNLLTEDSAAGAVANCADFPGLHRNRRECIAAGTKRESRSTTTRLRRMHIWKRRRRAPSRSYDQACRNSLFTPRACLTGSAPVAYRTRGNGIESNSDVILAEHPVVLIGWRKDGDGRGAHNSFVNMTW